MKKDEAVNLTKIMERDNITLIDRYVYQDCSVSFRVEIDRRHGGFGSTVGEAYLKAMAWKEN